MKDLSIVYVTNRYDPRIEWFLDSLWNQDGGAECEVIVVSAEHSRHILHPIKVAYVRPKPCIWSGPHRITHADWWSASNYRNTGICLATRPRIAFLDDRCVLLPGWLDCIKQAMRDNYVVCGTYAKVTQMVVEQGVPKTWIANPGKDSRLEYTQKYWIPHQGHRGPFKCPGEWTFGCSLALPLEWVLEIGGFDEMCDGSGGEDTMFGLMLQNRGRPIFFDPRMKMIEDRTAEESGPVFIKKDKGISPNDKSHALLDKLKGLNHVMLPSDLRSIRSDVQSGKPWPIPKGPTVDWYDGEPIKEMR